MASRARCLAALCVVTPLGFATKLYAGPGARWVAHELGGFLYVVFWILAALAVRPAWPPARVAAAVVAVTSALEVAQLWHPAMLEAIRATFLGRALLGTTFAWSDFPYYLAGGLAGWALARALGCGGPARPSGEAW